MNHSIYVHWGEHHVKLTWFPKLLPDVNKVTSVHGFCFHHGKVLLVKIASRGFNVPGGHIEFGETPEMALHREVYEEGYVNGNSKYLGMIEVNHEENPNFDFNGKYPLIGYQLFYRMDITSILPFLRENEASARIWVEPDQVPFVMDDHELATLILQEAVKAK